MISATQTVRRFVPLVLILLCTVAAPSKALGAATWAALGTDPSHHSRETRETRESGEFRESSETRQPQQTQRKQRILVYTEQSGGGHMAASRAVKSILEDQYEVKVIEPLANFPLIGNYNTNVRAGRARSLLLMADMIPLADIIANFSEEYSVTRRMLTAEILNFQPDLIISVIPLVNRLTQDILERHEGEILERHKRHIPLLVLTTDLEASHFFRGMHHPGRDVMVNLAFDDDDLKASLLPALTEENFIPPLGFPLRPEFGETTQELQPQIDEIREELGIRESDKTILIIMGAQGMGEVIVKYSDRIANSYLGSKNENLHVVALCGNNDELKTKTQATANPMNPFVKIHALGRKEGRTVAALMRMADLLITKPGGATVNEAFASNLYTLYHTDKSLLKYDMLLPWEAGNMRYGIHKGWGERLEGRKKFLNQLHRTLNQPRLMIEDCPGSDGPGGFYFNDPELAQGIGIIALILILFSGGLDTSWPRVRPVLKSAFALSTLGLLVTSGLVACFAFYFLNFNWTEGLLLGAIVSSTDAAAVFSVLEGKKIGGAQSPIKPLLELESGSNDSMAAFLTVGMIHMLTGEQTSALSLAVQFGQQLAVGLLVGFVIGKLATLLINRVKLESEGIYPVITTSVVTLSYGLSEVMGGNGFLTVYVVGIVMGNSLVLHKQSLLLFHDGLGWLMQIAMFITLGLLVFPRNLLPIAPAATGLAIFLILIARPIGVFLSLIGSRLYFRDKWVISWAGLRGAAPIVLATYPLLARIPKAEIIFNIVFYIVLTSVIIQGATIPYLGKWLSWVKQARIKKALVRPLL
ncbi:unnamed protein product [Sphagnum tenellum]